jgi:chromosome segregation ATPase
MPSIKFEDLSPFGRASLKLDREFAELARIAENLSNVDIGSDSGLDQAVKVLQRAAESGKAISDTMVEFSTTLQEARDKAEASTKVVADRAQLIQDRRQQLEMLQQKLEQVRDDVKNAGAALAGFSKPMPSDEDKRLIAEELGRMREPMTRFVDAAKAIKAEAARLNFKRLERAADSMIDSLQASLEKIGQALGPK